MPTLPSRTGRLKRAVRRRLPRRRFQPFFQRLHGWSLAGMGIGSAVWDFDESGEARFIEQFARWTAHQGPGQVTCVDVGANTGGYATLLVGALGPRCRVHSMEPASETYEQLRTSVADLPEITAHRVALGASAGSASLHTVPGHSQLASLHAFHDKPAVVEETVPVHTLDDWAARHGITHISLLKVDVEGAEAEVLAGARGLLAEEAIDVIQFEFGARNLVAGTPLRHFFDTLHGYVVHRMVVDGLVPIPSYRESLEIPISATNYVAVRRDLAGL